LTLVGASSKIIQLPQFLRTLAFTTVTGSNGVTSLVGATGVDVATIVTLRSNVFVGANTADDTVTIALSGNGAASAYDVRMGGGGDRFNSTSVLLNSFVSLDGTTLANDGNDTFNSTQLIINSEIVGRGGNDVLGLAGAELQLSNSTVNGNTGVDRIRLGASSGSYVYGGADTDTITTTAGAANSSSSVMINGNKGSDFITLAASGFATGTVYGGNGNDTINAAAITDAAAAALGVTAAGVELFGDLGDDTITGSNGIDTINGGDGSDVINGGTGADIINGGLGNDNITGGAGADVIDAVGNDVLVYTTLTDSALTSATSNTGFDTITEFGANTAAAVNGDRFDVAAAQVTAAAAAGGIFNAGSIAGGANLAATLDGAFDGNLIANGVGIVTINTGSFAGSYVVLNDNDVNYTFASDAVIKVNSTANIGAATFI
jgi:Ca2+-binding RTX toxin-like protein